MHSKAGCALANCGFHLLTPDKSVRIQADRAIIVTHATSFQGARLTSKRGTDVMFMH